MQFRVTDYAMEHCSVGAWIPSHETAAKTNRTFELANGSAEVELWNLTTSDREELNPYKVTWNKRPKRQALIGTLKIVEGQSTLMPSQFCETGSLQTFEFACPTAGCKIDFMQGATEPRLGEILSSRHIH